MTATLEAATRLETSLALPARPSWLDARLASRTATLYRDADVLLEGIDTSEWTSLRATVRDADRSSDATFRSSVRRAYTCIGRWLGERRLYPWRYWNYVPRIGATASLAADRYQVFNVGRFEGLASWSHGDGTAGLAAASAIGHCGRDLVIDVLAGPAQGVSRENPRQRPAWQYSGRWGPRPPSFARATLLPGAWLGFDQRTCALVSGTASIVGEDSFHRGNLGAQIDETCHNLAMLAPLDCYHSVRAYVAESSFVDDVSSELRRRLSTPAEVEIAVGDLCRPELLVEIEGIALLGG